MFTDSTAGDWLQVDLKHPTLLVAVVTQGDYDYAYWVTQYKISYSNTTKNFQYIIFNNGSELVSNISDIALYYMSFVTSALFFNQFFCFFNQEYYLKNFRPYFG